MNGKSSQMTAPEAIAMIRATPPEDRSGFASEIWRRRRARGTDRWTASEEVPF